MSGNETKSTVNKDPVAQTKIWKEVLYKEAKSQKIRTEFSVNPKSLKYIAEKPTKANPFVSTEELIKNFPLLNTKDEKTRQITEQLRETVAKFEQDTRVKHKQPQSTSMEIGWFHGIPQFEITQAKNDDSNDNDKEKENIDKNSEQDQESESLNVNTTKRWHYPLGQSSITKFAQHYTLTMGHNPFKRSQNPPPS